MTRFGVRELRQNLSAYLRRVKVRERFAVTVRGVPAALGTGATSPIFRRR
jgi:prevent-host-death family protein